MEGSEIEGAEDSLCEFSEGILKSGGAAQVELSLGSFACRRWASECLHPEGQDGIGFDRESTGSRPGLESDERMVEEVERLWSNGGRFAGAGDPAGVGGIEDGESFRAGVAEHGKVDAPAGGIGLEIKVRREGPGHGSITEATVVESCSDAQEKIA